MKRVLVTGGAGFIGSHLVEQLISEFEIVVLDDLSEGSLDNIQHHETNSQFSFIRGSITEQSTLDKALEGVDTIYHLAAQPDVRISIDRPLDDFEINVKGTLLILETMKRYDIKNIVFASSGGTVYGDTDKFPTPESVYLSPISNYGAAKAAVEMYLSSYAELYGINSVSLRLGNIIGPRSTHGVIFDFFMKLKRDPSKLLVLGTGNQEKGYMYVQDASDAFVLLGKNLKEGYLPINVSSGETLRVSRIAELVREQMGLADARIEYTGSTRGWTGDVVMSDIDISLLKSYGWRISTPLEKAVRKNVDWLMTWYKGKNTT
ncbi:MAG: SDR family NAD(P)-dependent oxidoreductase [Candidatus Thorarchaeota archaeon]|jgi:UDP-glucose 4-epimerase